MRFRKLPVPVLKQLTVLAYCIFFSVIVFCQKKEAAYKLGNVTAKDFDLSSYKIVNENTAGVILYESGSTHFIGNDKNWFSYVYTCTKKIKIIDKKAFDLATVEIPLRTSDNSAEKLSDVNAITYNMDNGTVTSVILDKSSIYSEKEDENFMVEKFTLPAVKEGSVIEYTYTITSDNDFEPPSWEFQSVDYPVLWSEYKMSFPSTLGYVSLKHGIDSFTIQRSWRSTETYLVRSNGNYSLGTADESLGVNSTTNNYQWVEQNVMPLKLESYVSSASNYIDKLEFQLSATYNGEEASQVASNWKSVCQIFFNDDDFEKALSSDYSWLKYPAELDNGVADLDEAKKIYYYIQNNYACTDYNFFKEADLYEVYKKQSGSERALNLLLIAMLRGKGIIAKPALLSTREHGYINSSYPIVYKFNYLICNVTINNNTYLLDASNHSLGFGELSDNCYNGYVRVLDENAPDSFYLSSDSLYENNITRMALTNDEDGKISGSYQSVLGKTASLNMREAMRKWGKEEYFKNYKKTFPFDVALSNTTIDSLDKPEMPVSVQYNISFKPEGDIIYFNPLFAEVIKENPFKAAQRFYPVEMPYCSNQTFVLNMQVPAGYKVDELPKSARISLNGNEGMFEYLIQQSGDNIQMRCKTQLNKAKFSPDDYETLRNFFTFIAEKEGEQIVFKKM